MVMKRIAFFLGGHIAPNVVRDVTNMGSMLSEEFVLDLIATDDPQVNDGFPHFSKFTFTGTSRRSEIFGLNEYLSNNNPDALVQMSQPTQHGWLTTLLGKRAGCSTVYRYGTDAFEAFRVANGIQKVKFFLFHNMISSWLPRIADKSIVLGPAGKEQLLRRGVDESDIGILPPTIATYRINPDTKTPPGIAATFETIQQENIVLFVGRLNRVKGFSLLMESIPQILQKRDDVHFVIAGSGEQPDLEDDLVDHVTFTGFVDPDHIGHLYDGADVFVLPSLREGLPRVLLEAQCAGLVTIAKDVGEVRSATENVFESRSEFIEMMCKFEDLPASSGEQFSRQNLQSDHIEFFSDLGE
ncbi:glycosyltransferase family 4 protein [Halorubrum laminariae]|uniref:Glycosyltransferase family 4 protein n=1 Tax=Halorubrum laminariae TaxID=1433523 RepID=A0ABD6C2X2_9EURY|nr:glycosyltransferase family 4 protein [Halorubrum laminariae]